MSKFIINEWKIIETGFDPKEARFSESIFSLGNEHMGLRGFFEETYSGDSLPGIYIGGVYYPDKTRVGWWKNGYPEFFAKIINSTNWIGIRIFINDVELDLARGAAKDFRRELDMKEGRLARSFTWLGPEGQETAFCFTRFLSRAETSLACVSVTATPLNYEGRLVLEPYLDGDVVNEDANYGEKFWEEVGHRIEPDRACLLMRTKKTGFIQATAMSWKLRRRGEELHPPPHLTIREKYLSYRLEIPLTLGEQVELQKYITVCTSRDFPDAELAEIAWAKNKNAAEEGYGRLFEKHRAAVEAKWADNDIVISGDPAAQQGIRFNIFQLHQTYTGKDPRLNIGPKGFSGEKYGGVTYWDTEAFCFPFYLYTDETVARNLLYYRYLHLEAARENARKLGFRGALYPMVTVDGRECHNEWEITFEEIHRNGAIAYAIYNYTNYTGNRAYLYEYGLQVLIEISRFWADRVTYNPRRGQYLILGVTGPNEYENNVNNNWYTNTIAAWTLEYTLAALREIREEDRRRYQALEEDLKLESGELAHWEDIAKRMYFPYSQELGIFEQNDQYLDKEQMLVKDLPPEMLPLNQHWSWDRILRSCFIKQADVIQGFYFFPERYDRETMRRNFEFYEPRTVHESSLSASIHSIVASRLGLREKAYELYLRTARLDLENYNKDTEEGLHLTSMAGSWAAIVQGFAGVMAKDERLWINPYLPGPWESYNFKITFRGRKLKISVAKEQVTVEQLSGEPFMLMLFEDEYGLTAGAELKVKSKTILP
ncbi:MAG: glycoside hydrolase family 65 protein [Firmicutes bacterium]|nr:glycoside hydrolase family 65 protein [Bacillota bacterium]